MSNFRKIAEKALAKAKSSRSLRERVKDDYLPTDLGAQGIGPKSGGSDDDFHRAVALLRKTLDGASSRRDQAFVDDLSKALELLSKWQDSDKATEARQIHQRQNRIRELFRRG